MFKLIWPILIFIGIISVLLIDAGSGLNSPGFWLVPIGIAGGFATIFRLSKSKSRAQAKKYKAQNISLVLIWLAAFFCIGGLYFSWFTDGFTTFIYFWPAIVFTFTGLIFITVLIVKR